MKLAEMTAPEISDASGNTIALLPIGATEQHGPHLGVATDSILVSHIAEQAERALQEIVVLCPTLAYGSSHHHLTFGGTLSISAELFTSVLVDLVQSLRSSGFARIVILNGHGGNIVPARQALSILGRRSKDVRAANIAFVTYWELAGEPFQGQAPMESAALSHACEYETSMMLHASAECVRMEKAERSATLPSNGYFSWEDEEPYRGISMFFPTELVSSNGSSGEPQLASAAKGAHLIDQAVRALGDFLKVYQHWPFREDLRRA
jgi:creatinine amidohydrolase